MTTPNCRLVYKDYEDGGAAAGEEGEGAANPDLIFIPSVFTLPGMKERTVLVVGLCRLNQVDP